MSAGAGPSTIHVPPLPDKRRAEPRQEEIGPGRPYANAAAFSADHARWEQESDARRKLMAERLKAQKKVHEQSRDRTARQRPPDDGDRREKQRQQQHSSARSQSFKTPTIQLFFQLANSLAASLYFLWDREESPVRRPRTDPSNQMRAHPSTICDCLAG